MGARNGFRGKGLTDRFDFLAPNDIRIKGHRIGVEDVLFAHLDGLVPEEIALHYPSLSLDEIAATLELYEQNRERLDAYLRGVQEHERRMREEQRSNPGRAAMHLHQLAASRRAGV